MKRLIFCFDGTGNTLEKPYPTNVALVASMIKAKYRSVSQIVHYDEGVGTHDGNNFLGGAFGRGLFRNIIEAYSFLVFNYEPGDQVFIFGFSRGAYTARSFAGMLQYCGILRSVHSDKIKVASELYRNRKKSINESDDLPIIEFRKHAHSVTTSETPIKYIGVWDTVKTLGSSLIDFDFDGESDPHEFHDDSLHSSVEAARHAVAIDERRDKFDVTLWDNIPDLNNEKGFDPADDEAPYLQKWFPGTHGSVGGGGDIRGLSDETLEWILMGAKAQGLALNTEDVSKIYGIRPDPLAEEDNVSEFSWNPASLAMRLLRPRSDRNGPSNIYEISHSAIVRWAAPDEAISGNSKAYRPKTLKKIKTELNKKAKEFKKDHFLLKEGYKLKDQIIETRFTHGGDSWQRHVVKARDTLSKIAKKYYGDPNLFPLIVEANKVMIADSSRIYKDQILLIPPKR